MQVDHMAPDVLGATIQTDAAPASDVPAAPHEDRMSASQRSVDREIRQHD